MSIPVYVVGENTNNGIKGAIGCSRFITTSIVCQQPLLNIMSQPDVDIIAVNTFDSVNVEHD
jgi:hypothetical protein